MAFDDKNLGLNIEKTEETQWKVYFGSGFWKHHGRDRAGDERIIGKSFEWNQRLWHIPAVYVCTAGLVVDFCIEIEPEQIKRFVQKAEAVGFDDTRLSPEEREELEAENPLNIDFYSKITVNGKELSLKNGCSMSWIPQDCLPECMSNGEHEEVFAWMEHYRLDTERGWVIYRQSFPWEYKRKPAIRKLCVSLEPRLTAITAGKFKNPKGGECITVLHPQTGVEHVVRIQDISQQKIEHGESLEEKYECPEYYRMMSYTVTPDLSDREFSIADCCQSDEPRRKQTAKEQKQGMAGSEACAIGIIGGADGPTAVFLAVKQPGGEEKLHTACSGLRFEPVNDVEWKMVFRVKPCEAIKVELIGS